MVDECVWGGDYYLFEPSKATFFLTTTVTINRTFDFSLFLNYALYHSFIAFFYHFPITSLKAVVPRINVYLLFVSQSIKNRKHRDMD